MEQHKILAVMGDKGALFLSRERQLRVVRLTNASGFSGRDCVVSQSDQLTSQFNRHVLIHEETRHARLQVVQPLFSSPSSVERHAIEPSISS